MPQKIRSGNTEVNAGVALDVKNVRSDIRCPVDKFYTIMKRRKNGNWACTNCGVEVKEDGL